MYGNRYGVPVKYVKYDDEEPLPKERKHTVTPFVLPSSTQQQCTVGCADLTDDGNGLH